MRKVLISLLLMAWTAPMFSQTSAINGFCDQGGAKAKTQGLFSTNFQQGIIPSCTVTVYLTGTSTKATIYADSIGTALSNPFTANAASSTAPGKWIFYAATGQGFDIQLSGGIAPNTYLAPVVFTSVLAGGSQMIYPSAGIANSTGSVWGPSYGTTGTGNLVALSVSPAFTTPSLGAATAISLTAGLLADGNGSSTQGAIDFQMGTGELISPKTLYHVGIVGPTSGTPNFDIQLPNAAPSDDAGDFLVCEPVQNINNRSQSVCKWESISSVAAGCTTDCVVTDPTNTQRIVQPTDTSFMIAGAISIYDSSTSTGAIYFGGSGVVSFSGTGQVAIDGSYATGPTFVENSTAHACAGNDSFLCGAEFNTNTQVNADLEVNGNQRIYGNLTINGTVTVRPIAEATSLTNYNSNNLYIAGSYYSTSTSQPISSNWKFTNIVGSGSSPTSVLTIANAATNETRSISMLYPVTVASLSNSNGVVIPLSTTGYTGSGNVVLSNSPGLTGTLTAAAATFSGNTTFSNAPIFSSLTGYVYCNGSNACTASTTTPVSSAITTTSKSDNYVYYLTFVAANSTSNQSLDVGSIQYNPSTGRLDNIESLDTHGNVTADSYLIGGTGIQDEALSTAGIVTNTNTGVLGTVATTGTGSVVLLNFPVYSDVGNANLIFGSSFSSNTTGSGNTANGNYALYANTTGYDNTANGENALYANTTGYGNVANGNAAGRYLADGTTGNSNSINSVFEGRYTKAAAASDTNEIVIGYNAIGVGSNTAVIGDSDVTDVYLGSASANARLHANSIASTKVIGSTYVGCTVGAAAGSGATCVCATNYTCTTNSGTLTLVTGTGTASGLAATVQLYSSAQSSYPNCTVDAENTAAMSTVAYTVGYNEGFTRQAWSAPAASTTYTIHYTCGY